MTVNPIQPQIFAYDQVTPLAVLEAKILLACFLIFKQMSRQEQVHLRDVVENIIMKRAEETRGERITQGWWSMGSGIASGVAGFLGAIASGVAAVKTDLKWIDSVAKGADALSRAASGIGQGGAGLKGADVGRSESFYEQSKRLMEAQEKQRQANQSSEQAIVQMFDQLLAAAARRFSNG